MKEIKVEVDDKFYDALKKLGERSGLNEEELIHESLKLYSLFVCLTDRKGYDNSAMFMKEAIMLYSYLHRMYEMGARIIVDHGGIKRNLSEIFDLGVMGTSDNMYEIPLGKLERIAGKKTSNGKPARIIDLFKD